MVGAIAIGLVVLVGLLFLMRWFVGADPKLLARAARIVLLVIGAVIVIVLFATGRAGIASILVGGLLPLLLRWQAAGRLFRNAAGPSPGQRSEVSARFIRMTLDHDTGSMSGTVLDGPHRGRHLHELSRDDLMALLRECRAEDPQSASLLEAWLDRADPEWRGFQESGPAAQRPPSSGRMTRDEAYRILGLAPGADHQAIKDAHRRLMQKLHPDHGGSDYLAAKLNEAKDLLLGT